MYDSKFDSDFFSPHRWDVVVGSPPDFVTSRRLLESFKARPLTFRENVVARLDQKNGFLWDDWLDSCSGIAYDAGSLKFKVVPLSMNLLNAGAVEGGFIPVDYGSIEGVELDPADDAYNRLLTRDEVVKHEGWLAALENDKKLLKKYAESVFGRLGYERAMGFWLERRPVQNQLRALCLEGVDYSCSCYGNRDLNVFTRFALIRSLSP